MKIKYFADIPPTKFESDAVKGVSGRVAIGKDDGAPNFCMRVFELASDGFTPRHSHEWEHEIFIHSGKGEVFDSEEWQPVSAGCAVFFPGNEEHQIRNTGDGNLVFICLIPSGVPEL